MSSLCNTVCTQANTCQDSVQANVSSHLSYKQALNRFHFKVDRAYVDEEDIGLFIPARRPTGAVPCYYSIIITFKQYKTSKNPMFFRHAQFQTSVFQKLLFFTNT